MTALVDFESMETGYLDRFYTLLETAERFVQMYQHERDNIEFARRFSPLSAVRCSATSSSRQSVLTIRAWYLVPQ